MAQERHLRAASFVLCFSTLFQFSSCTTAVNRSAISYNMQVLSTELIKTRQLTPDDLKKIQFYIGRDLIFSGRSIAQNSSTTNNRLLLADSITFDTITLRSKTPGTATKVWKNNEFLIFGASFKIAVCFIPESGLCEQEHLIFSPDRSGLYRLESQPWNGTLKYGEQNFQCLTGCVNNFLYFERGAMNRLIQKRRTLPGRTFSTAQSR